MSASEKWVVESAEGDKLSFHVEDGTVVLEINDGDKIVTINRASVVIGMDLLYMSL